MGTLIDETGKRYGRLTVIHRAKSKNGRTVWMCKCDCGGITQVAGVNLRNGHTKSCGCIQKEKASIQATERNIKHGMCGTRLYKIWQHMIERCTNEECQTFPSYGGRGIVVCEEWLDFIPFHKWAVSSGYNDTLTIDRIDVNGNYCPENCRWATIKEQQNNKRNTVYIEHEGVTHTMTEWAEITGISYSTLRSRRRNGDKSPEIFRKVGRWG